MQLVVCPAWQSVSLLDKVGQIHVSVLSSDGMCMTYVVIQCHQHLSCHNWQHYTIPTPVFIIIICALCTFTKRWSVFTNARSFTCLNQITLYTWTFIFFPASLFVSWWNTRSDDATLCQPCCYLIVYTSPVYWSNRPTLLHILNNDHTFGINDKKKNWHYKQLTKMDIWKN